MRALDMHSQSELQGRVVGQREIPLYYLYGETSRDVEERFIHIESIAERSGRYDWKIRPHAHRDLHHLMILTRGGGVMHAEGNPHALRAPALINVPMACVHGFRFEPDSAGWVLTVAEPLLHRLTRDHPELSTVLNEVGATPLPATGAAAMEALVGSLLAEYRGSRVGRRAAVECGLTGVLVNALRAKIEHKPQNGPTRRTDTALVARYRAMIEDEFRNPIGVAECASRLCVSREQLRLACVRTTGNSPLALLNSRRLLEAKRCLLYTNMRVAQIAGTCGFDDPAYFSRFFRRSTGMPPRAYRRNREAEFPA